MKALVIKAFTDIDDGVTFKKGDSIEMSESRVNALVELGYVKADDTAKEEPKRTMRKSKKSEE